MFGDVISLRPRENLKNLYKSIISENSPDSPEWVAFDSEGLQATVQREPGPEDVSLPVDANTVVEFLSR